MLALSYVAPQTMACFAVARSGILGFFIGYRFWK